MPSRLESASGDGSEAVALVRVLGAPSAAAVMIGLMVGSGIFRVPSPVAAAVDSVPAIALLWVLGGLLALFGSLCVAELACMYPEAGGVYVFLREAYGPLAGFLYGWTRLLLLVPASVGAISLIFAAYLGAFVPLDETAERWIAAATILLVTALNYRSLPWSALIENVVTTAKVLALGLVAVGVLAMTGGSGSALEGSLTLSPSSWAGFGLALVTVMWTYSGWSSIAALAGEVREPSRNMPRALIGGTVLVIVLYLAMNAAYLGSMTLDQMAESRLVAADAAARILGDGGAQLIAALVALSTFGAVHAAVMFNPRIFYAMARDGLLFSLIGGAHREFRTPHMATLFTALLGIAYVSLRSFEQLAQAFILGVWPFHILMVLAVFRLRKTRPHAERPYRTWGYPMAPALFLAASAAMVLNALVQEPGLTLFGFGLIGLGIPVYFLVIRRGGPNNGRQPAGRRKP